ncbi:hypothetical protein KTAU_20510 [Thermogemmatispora aurantia]|jgi:hypothetical protein|uniref:Uncharacterized protein n=1 Tax=Thermogemmatispora aurantia TaxID=2045279 RepID=A0A5J4K427_9CHLR|nr:hypothetical protein [Thermogemmatispora aurantia]GER83414.1 hypothetical protein KTAU_20510 [Thermogemmatispora aurantia]
MRILVCNLTGPAVKIAARIGQVGQDKDQSTPDLVTTLCHHFLLLGACQNLAGEPLETLAQGRRRQNPGFRA